MSLPSGDHDGPAKKIGKNCSGRFADRQSAYTASVSVGDYDCASRPGLESYREQHQLLTVCEKLRASQFPREFYRVPPKRECGKAVPYPGSALSRSKHRFRLARKRSRNGRPAPAVRSPVIRYAHLSDPRPLFTASLSAKTRYWPSGDIIESIAC